MQTYLFLSQNQKRGSLPEVYGIHISNNNPLSKIHYFFPTVQVYTHGQCVHELTKQPLSLLDNGIVKTVSRIVGIFPFSWL